MWRQVSDPAVLPFVPLFFEVLGQALQRRPGTEAFLDNLTTPWVDEGLALARTRGDADGLGPADAQLAIAVVRGLLIDLAATGDRDAAGAALARFTALLRAAGAGEGGRPRHAGRPRAHSPVVGSITVLTRLTTSAGKPPQSACSRTAASSSAM